MSWLVLRKAMLITEPLSSIMEDASLNLDLGGVNGYDV